MLSYINQVKKKISYTEMRSILMNMKRKNYICQTMNTKVYHSLGYNRKANQSINICIDQVVLSIFESFFFFFFKH